MIWASWAQQADVLADLGWRMCPHCSNMAPHAMLRLRKKAKLYGVPVAKWGAKIVEVCGVCRDLRPLTPEQVTRFTDVYVVGSPSEVSTPRIDALDRDPGGRETVVRAFLANLDWCRDNADSYIPPSLDADSDTRTAIVLRQAVWRTASDVGVDFEEMYAFHSSGRLGSWLREHASDAPSGKSASEATR